MQASVNSPGAGLCPVQRTLLNNPNVSDDQNAEKYQHFRQTKQSELPIYDRPGKQEDGLDIENHEQNGDDVVANRITLPRIGIRIDAALIRHQFPFSTG